MKFATAKEHRDFFQKKHWIEFEGLLSKEQLALVNQTIDQVLAERLNVPAEKVRLLPSEKFYLHGRDLWRHNLVLQKLATRTRFAELATELIEKKPLRLGYDQLFPECHQPPFSQQTAPVYSHFLERTASLEAVSCLQGIACGIMVALGGQENLPAEHALSKGIDVYPNQPGNLIFFQPRVEVDWGRLYAHLGQRFLMIVYTQAFAHYQLQPQDPHTHALKRLGYVFNDRLSDRLNPIVYR
jgi:hypothetical protein